MAEKNRNPNREALRDSPVAWFSVLERAWRTGDAALEQRAISQLNRLGIIVNVQRPLTWLREKEVAVA